MQLTSTPVDTTPIIVPPAPARMRAAALLLAAPLASITNLVAQDAYAKIRDLLESGLLATAATQATKAVELLANGNGDEVVLGEAIGTSVLDPLTAASKTWTTIDGSDAGATRRFYNDMNTIDAALGAAIAALNATGRVVSGGG